VHGIYFDKLKNEFKFVEKFGPDAKNTSNNFFTTNTLNNLYEITPAI